MILIADSGSTKTDWCLTAQGSVSLRVRTKGINPFFQTEEEILAELRHTLQPQLPEGESIDAIHFYGAGCTPERAPLLRRAIGEVFPAASGLEVCSDLLAAARGLCGHEGGIACILGTGSNSCFYDGKAIAQQVSPLGFILGDEGSGAYLGKLLVGDVLKRQLPPDVQKAFFAETGLTAAEIIDRTYRQPFPNRFLAGLSPFIARHLDRPELRQLARNAFVAFLKRNVAAYPCREYPAHFVGSIACHYEELLREAAQETGVRIGKICQSPMDGLVDYHAAPLR
ncbi:MAG: ATPase [Mediterranea sp.]|jgi:N-acetylglucosamine kinase-like BadF-type ATPase|nr:ATPase [Mediterranea sp.]